MADQERSPNDADTSRRSFVKGVAVAVGSMALTSKAADVFASTTTAAARLTAAPNWADQIGLELFTVRDVTPKDYVGTLEKIAAIGYKEIEPAGGYNNMSPKQYRALLDRLGLKMPSTHSGITAGPPSEMEQQLAGFEIMGVEYSEFSAPRPAGAGRGNGRGRVPTAPQTPAAERKNREQFVKTMAQPRTVDDVKQEAARYNSYGKIAQKFGIKVLIHNHTVEFIPCTGSSEIPYDILLKDTDPELVAFQLDIGWATVAGQNAISLFQQHPGRVPLWHVKDVDCLRSLPPVSEEGARMVEARLVPIGNGEIDYAEIFKYANVAGLKHFCIEQDSAAEWGDSIAAARVSYQQLRAMLGSSA
jgi:sugar phosphate isomerase/epimerase